MCHSLGMTMTHLTDRTGLLRFNDRMSNPTPAMAQNIRIVTTSNEGTHLLAYMLSMKTRSIYKISSLQIN